MRALILLAGWSQLALAAGSLLIPRTLGWREDTARLKPLTRQVFWTYAAYIWVTNIGFGLLSVLGADQLLTAAPLARALCAFAAAWWGARLGVQFFYFDRSATPPGAIYRLAEAALVALFIFLTGVYAWLAL